MKKIEADVVVIGAGPSGLAAAAQSAENGLNVVVFEKAAVVTWEWGLSVSVQTSRVT